MAAMTWLTGSKTQIGMESVNSGSPVHLCESNVSWGLPVKTFEPQMAAGSSIPQNTVQWCGLGNPIYTIEGVVDLNYSQPSPKDRIDKALLELFAKATGTKFFVDKDFVGTGSVECHIVGTPTFMRVANNRSLRYTLELKETA
jgi:hypothetical protein